MPGDAFLGVLLECVGIPVAAHKAAVFLLQGSAAGPAGDGKGGHMLVYGFGAGWDYSLYLDSGHSYLTVSQLSVEVLDSLKFRLSYWFKMLTLAVLRAEVIDLCRDISTFPEMHRRSLICPSRVVLAIRTEAVEGRCWKFSTMLVCPPRHGVALLKYGQGVHR